LTVTVLRLLEAERPEPHGGMVTYLAEASEPVGAVAWRGELHPHPLRQRYARRGGPASDLVWAKSALLSLGMRPEGPPVQIRTWNLSSIWRIPTHGETVWLKSVPLFFAHEVPLLSALSGQRVPTVLSCEAGRMLLREAPGEDMHDASVSKCKEMVDLLIGLQAMWRDRVDQLLSLGLPDWRGPALIPAIGEVVSRTASQLSTEERAALTGFVEQLPARLAEIASCGLPDTLAHGDFHPGNLRGDGHGLTLIDWGDSGVGHPLLNQPAFFERQPASAIAELKEFWSRRWLELCPRSNPTKAADLIAPIAAARQAVIYRRFLDNIEPAEHPYHQADPARWLRRTAALLRR
jgi:Ser/Thr protein kinase RdoA (MazF antagonist)